MAPQSFSHAECNCAGNSPRHRIHYTDEGQGDPIVFIHGNPTSSLLWRNVAPQVGQALGRRSIAIDLLGFGKSDKPLLDYKVQTYVDFLNEFLRQLKIDRATLVGESMGGWIAGLDAIEVAKNPHLVPVDTLILVDAAGLPWREPPLCRQISIPPRSKKCALS